MTPSNSPLNDAAPAQDVESLLVEVLERLTSGEGDAVDAICRAHPVAAAELRERVDALRAMNLLPTDSAAMAFPERLGRYRLVRRLGGGGMGVVYEALEETTARLVALKLIRPENLYFPRAKERFRRETQAVSCLSHPGIVALHEVGEANGTPYLAMELIEGATLAQALEQFHGVTPESLSGRDLRAAAMARASTPIDEQDAALPELFAGSWVDACVRIARRMCEALAHAHERGILHRDIKPSNIVLTPDGRAVLVDFGLAGLETEGRMTLTGATLGSALYMSPEQVAGRANDIDARTDVYALGVTLYELLSLQPPYAGVDAEQTRAAILEGQPTSIRARNREVSRELETVCFKAIERERARRYASMADFGRDLQAVLQGGPIVARPPSALYRAWRWVRRRPTLSTAMGALLALSVVGPLGLYVGERRQTRALEAALAAESEARAAATAERQRADDEAREAEAVSNYLVGLFSAADPYRGGARDVRASDLLAAGLRRIDGDLSDQPELQARLLAHIGESFTNLERYDEALPPLERALQMRRERLGDDALETAQSKFLLASAMRLSGDRGYVPLLRECLVVFERDGESSAWTRISCNALLALSLIDLGELEEAAARLDRLVAEVESASTVDRVQRWNWLAMLAAGQQRLRRYDEAERVARAALALDASGETTVAPHAYRAAALDTLGIALREQARTGEALEVYAELLPLSAKLYAADNPVLASQRSNYARVLLDAGRVEEAILEARAALESIEPRLGFHNAQSLNVLKTLTAGLMRDGRYDEALELLERALDDVGARVGTQDPANSIVWMALAELRLARGEPRLAVAAATNALETVAESYRADVLGLLAYASSRAHATPQDVASAAVQALEARGVRGHVDARLALALSALERGDRRDARKQATEALAAASSAERLRWSGAVCDLLLVELERAEGAPEVCARSVDALNRLTAALHPTHGELRAALERLAPLRSECAELDRLAARLETLGRER